MKSRIRNYQEIARELKKEYPNIPDFEIISLAVQIERNEILENGLVVSASDEKASGLEAISIALGYDDKQNKTTITDVLKDILNKG